MLSLDRSCREYSALVLFAIFRMLACLRLKLLSFGSLQVTGKSPHSLYMCIVCMEENAGIKWLLEGFWCFTSGYWCMDIVIRG